MKTIKLTAITDDSPDTPITVDVEVRERNGDSDLYIIKGEVRVWDIGALLDLGKDMLAKLKGVQDG